MAEVIDSSWGIMETLAIHMVLFRDRNEVASKP